MELIQWTDANGYERRCWVRDRDVGVGPDAEFKIECDPPDLSFMDWGSIESEMGQPASFFIPFRRELHNQLGKRGIFSWRDVERLQGNGILPALKSAIHATYTDSSIRSRLYGIMKTRLIMLYKQTRR